MTDSIVPLSLSMFDFKGNFVRNVNNPALDVCIPLDDICSVLGINNASQAVGRLDEDEKCQIDIPDRFGRIQKDESSPKRYRQMYDNR